jgi:molecular chaperone DnaK
MDEPTEPQPIVPTEPSAERPLPQPITARSTVHPWEEPPLLPAPSMFPGSQPASVHGRHAGRSRPVAMASLAAAAVVLVAGSAVAAVSLASSGARHAPTGTSRGGAQAAGPLVPGLAAPSAPAATTGVGSGLVPARFAQTHTPAPSSSDWFRAPVTTAQAPISPSTSGSGSTASQSAHGTAPSTGGATPSTGGSGRSGVPVTGSGPGSSPPGTRPPIVVPPVGWPTTVPSPEQTVPSSDPGTSEPGTTRPSSDRGPKPKPEPAPKPRPTRTDPAPEPSDSDPLPTESAPAPDPVESEPAQTPPSSRPSPSHTDSGLHKAIDHLLDPPGVAVGHTEVPAIPGARATRTAEPSPTAATAE